MKKNHNIRRFICALIAAGMLTSAASTGVFADSPSNDHPGNSQTQGTPGFDQGNNANTGHGQDGTGNGSLTGEDSEPDNKPDKDNDKNEKPDKDHGHKPGKPDKDDDDDDDDDRDDHDDDDDDKDDGVNTGDGENTGDNGGSSNSGNTGSNGGSTVTPAVPAPAPVQNLTAAPAAVTVQTLAAPAAAETVEEEPAPLAAPAEAAPEQSVTLPETIEEEPAPLAQTAGAHWALLNLLFTLAGIAPAIPAGLRRMGAARLAPVAVAACAVVILILTLDLTLPMGLADIWTLPLPLWPPPSWRCCCAAPSGRTPALSINS